MQTIEVTTTQKVTIEYELAPLRDRALAWFLDMLFLGLGILFVWIVMQVAFPDLDLFYIQLIFAVIFIFYTLVSEYSMNGQTFGKRLIGVKVIKLDGSAPQLNDYLLRWCFRMVDIYLTAGSVAALLVSSSNRGQRLGGMASNTVVIKVKFDLRFKLEDILRINTLEDYTPSYPQVRRLSEQDMLLIKNIINRYRLYPNDSHKDVVKELVEHLTFQLSLPDLPTGNKIEFLKTLLRDYIVLTR